MEVFGRSEGGYRAIAFPLLFYGILTIGLSTLRTVTGNGGGIESPTELSTGFSAGYYGIYIIIGWLLKRKCLRMVKKSSLVIIAIASMVMMIIEQLLYLGTEHSFFVWYNDLFLFLCAVCVFEIIIRKDIKCKDGVQKLSQNSFSIYLFNDFFRLIFVIWIWNIENADLNRVIYFFAIWAFITLTSLIFATLVKKIPLIGKLY